MQRIDHRLYYQEGFMSPQKCAEMVELMESTGVWSDGDRDDNPPPVKYRHRNQQVIRHNGLQGVNLGELTKKDTSDKLVIELINHAVLVSQHKGLLEIEHEQSVQVLLPIKNEVGGFFKKHQDTAMAMNRDMTALLYLSDASTHELEGGVTTFWGRERVHMITPKAGTLVVYDPLIHHEGGVVTKGTKYMIACVFGKKL